MRSSSEDTPSRSGGVFYETVSRIDGKPNFDVKAAMKREEDNQRVINGEFAVQIAAFKLLVSAGYASGHLNIGDYVLMSGWILDVPEDQRLIIISILEAERLTPYYGKSNVLGAMRWDEEQQCFYIVEAS